MLGGIFWLAWKNGAGSRCNVPRGSNYPKFAIACLSLNFLWKWSKKLNNQTQCPNDKYVNLNRSNIVRNYQFNKKYLDWYKIVMNVRKVISSFFRLFVQLNANLFNISSIYCTLTLHVIYDRINVQAKIHRYNIIETNWWRLKRKSQKNMEKERTRQKKPPREKKIEKKGITQAIWQYCQVVVIYQINMQITCIQQFLLHIKCISKF